MKKEDAFLHDAAIKPRSEFVETLWKKLSVEADRPQKHFFGTDRNLRTLLIGAAIIICAGVAYSMPSVRAKISEWLSLPARSVVRLDSSKGLLTIAEAMEMIPFKFPNWVPNGYQLTEFTDSSKADEMREAMTREGLAEVFDGANAIILWQNGDRSSQIRMSVGIAGDNPTVDRYLYLVDGAVKRGSDDAVFLAEGVVGYLEEFWSPRGTKEVVLTWIDAKTLYIFIGVPSDQMDNVIRMARSVY